jgi:hypothetical protein
MSDFIQLCALFPHESYTILLHLEDVFDDTSFAEVSSLHYLDACNFFFMTEFIDHLGVSPQFLDGSFVWDSTGSNRSGTMASRDVIALLLAFCKMIKQPSSVDARKKLFYQLWNGSFNTAAIKDFVLFYVEPAITIRSRYIHPEEIDGATKDELISLLVDWNVPFVPYTVWDEFIIRAAALREYNSDELVPLSINANRLAFYVRHGVINDSRSSLQIASVNGIAHPDDVRDYRTSEKINSDFLHELSKSFPAPPVTPRSVPAPPPAKRKSSAAPASASRHKKLASIGASDDSNLDLLGNYAEKGDDSSSSSSDPDYSSPDSSGDEGECSSDSSSSSSASSSPVSKGELKDANEEKLRKIVVDNVARLKRSQLALSKLASKSSKKTSKPAKSKKSSKAKHKVKAKKEAKSQGIHHYNTCVKELDKLIKNRGFINFYEYTHDRRNALKQLGCKSKPAANIGGFWISTSSPQIPDAATVLRSISNLSSGFYFYLTRLTGITRMSHLAPDRIQWWSWLAAKFSDSESALLHFVTNFMLLHHAADSWLGTAQDASQMYTDARRFGDANPLVTGSSFSPPDHRDGSTKRQKKTPVVVKQQRTVWTQQQQNAVKALKAQCPADTCTSRVISNLKCAAEKRGRKCNFSHVCGWCRSASCEAQCAKTPPSPVL